MARGGAGWRGVDGVKNRNRHHTAFAGGFTYRYSAVAPQGKHVGIRGSNMARYICSHGELESF